MQTGLPPKVDACARDHGAERHPRGDTLRGADNVWLDTGVIASPPLACASHAGLHFIGHEHDAVLAADALQTLQELRGSGQVATFTLNRLDENSSDFVGIHATAEEFVFKIREAIGGGVFGTNSVCAAVGVRKRHVEDAGEKRAESLALDGAAGGE